MAKEPRTIKSLVEGFAANIRDLKSSGYKESQVRLHYLDPFWKLLGWDVANHAQLAPQDVDVIVEPSMDSADDEGLKVREPDYLFRVHAFPRFVVEAKKPSVDIDTDKKAIFQAKRYAWNATIPFAILTDFEQFRLFDTTLRPILNEPNRGLVSEFSLNFEDYPVQWDELVATFSRDAVADGSLERLRAKIKKVSSKKRLRTVDRMLFELRGEEPVDRIFLDYLEVHRQQLARAIYEANKKDFPDADTLFRLNRFDWEGRIRGFGRLLDEEAEKERGRRGFDCIIGNPPYIRVQELKKWSPDECEFYKWRYKSAEKGNYDIYVVFTERCLELLSKQGLLGFIMPHKFWQAKYGEGIRKIIADGKHLKSIVDFTHETVFREASIYTAVQVFSKAPNKADVHVSRFEELHDGPSQMLSVDTGEGDSGCMDFNAIHPVGQKPWLLIPPDQSRILSRMQEASQVTLEDITDRMAQGIRTSMNPVYVLEVRSASKGRYYSDFLNQEITLEPNLLRPFLTARDMRRYELRQSKKAVLIPYQTNSNKLIPTEWLEKEVPLTWRYLLDCESALRSRERGRMDCPKWYGFVYPKNLSLIDSPKLLVPDIVENPSFSLDPKGGHAFVSGYALTLNATCQLDSHYLLGVLNSRLAGIYLKAISTPLRGGWYRTFPQFMSQIPIKLPDTPNDKQHSQAIIKAVTATIDARSKLRNGKLSDRERRSLEGAVESHERQINEAVLRLYGVDSLPK